MCSADSTRGIGRRGFLSQLGVAAATAGLCGSDSSAIASRSVGETSLLPTTQLGPHAITRLVAGWNPIGGHSYLGPHMDRHMKEYFTVEQTVRFLLDCEAAGINAHQFSPSETTGEVLRRVRERGSRMSFFGLHAGREGLDEIIRDTQPFALAHHGGVTDRLFHEGRSREVHDYVKDVQDRGLLAGVSAHNPDCIRQVADEGWSVDFFMCCFYYLTRPSGPESVQVPDTLQIGYSFYRDDPAVMTRVMRAVDQPCLAFKILGAGRLCATESMVHDAFQFAFANIKPTDGVIVGMYPRFFDEITANAHHAQTLAG